MPKIGQVFKIIWLLLTVTESKENRGENIEKAIAFFEAALQVYTRDAFAQDWAMTQNNLANAYKDRIKGDRGENIEKAIAFFQAALEVYYPPCFPPILGDDSK